MVGNRNVNQIIQTKLSVSSPGDHFEQEADRIADQVMTGNVVDAGISNGPAALSRKCASCSSGNGTCQSCEDEKIQRKPLVAMRTPQTASAPSGLGNSLSNAGEGSEPGTATGHAEADLANLNGGSQRLPESLRTFFEPQFNHDFSNVRLFNNAAAGQLAQSLHARAFTLGNQVVFGPGQFAPHTQEGQRLIAHELVHVVQQQPFVGSSPSLVQRQATPDSPAGETAAAAPGLIVDDELSISSSAQMKKSEFLEILRFSVCRAAEAALAGTGRSTADCPYLDFWFSFYGLRNAQYVERAIRRYAPETAGVQTARQYVRLITARVRQSVQVWARTGKVTGIPEGINVNPEALAAPQRRNRIQRKGRVGAGDTGGSYATPGPHQLGRGQALDVGVRSRMESAFGTDLSTVTLHTGGEAVESANKVAARAFTVGNHIAFGAGEYRPGTIIGDALIAHELAHTIQQRHNGDEASFGPAHHEDSGLEHDADASAVGAVVSLWGRGKLALANFGKNALPRMKSGLQMQRCSRTVKRCPSGKSWQVVNQALGVGPVCVCTWKCLTGGSSGGYESSGPSIDCDPPGSCPRPRVEVVGDDYQVTSESKVQDQGSVNAVGGHFTPIGAPAVCGCIPLDIEGGEISGAPLVPVGLQLTDVAGAAVAPRANRYVPEQIDQRPVAAEVRSATGAGRAGAAGGGVVGGGGGGVRAVAPAPAAPQPQQPITASAPPSPGGTQPKAIQDILKKNAPARNPGMQQRLQKDIDNYRSNTGIRRVDEPVTPDAPVRGGTVAVARTDIKSLDNRPFGGASPEALPANLKGKPGTTGGTTLTPTNPVAVDHGEHVALENLRGAIDSALESKAITRQDLVGKSVWVRVEQEPCSSCAGGLENPAATQGPISQFSTRYPELKIEVRSSRTSRSYYIQNGKAVEE
jgi:hypothetical protein